MEILIEALHSVKEPEQVANNSGNALTLVVFEISFLFTTLDFWIYSLVFLGTQELCP